MTSLLKLLFVFMFFTGGCDNKEIPLMSDAVNNGNSKTQLAMFGAGCFWHVDYEFSQLEGVVATTSGYAGGSLENPSYKEVCSDRTGHAEVVLVEYDPDKITYEKLLDSFWKMHDPTQLNRQGPDFGTQYRSVIFCYTEDQLQRANESMRDLSVSDKYKNEVVTQILPVPHFWSAEEYHQKYLIKRGKNSCGI